MIATALKLAQQGKVIFPCGPDKRPLVKWATQATCDADQVKAWRAHWPAAMIGLPCGEANDLLVIDLDVDKQTGELIGQTTLEALGYGQLLEGPRVTTPSGGLHLYFKHWSGGRNSVCQMGPGIDVRTQGGYVIASGSEGSAGRYEGEIDWSTLPSLPLGLRARVTKPPKPAVTFAPRATTDDELSELLGHIPADADYQSWVTVLMALHAHFGGSEAGLLIADQWSAQGSKYEAGEVAKKWHSFKRSGVTFASLAAIARENGADLSAITRKHARAANG